MSSSFYKMSEYVNTSLSPFSETEVYLYKQNLPMLPSESMMEIHHLIFAVIHFLIIFLQNISSTKSSPIVYFSQPMCLTQISFFHDEAMNTHVYRAVMSVLRLATYMLPWLRLPRPGFRVKFMVSRSEREVFLNQLLLLSDVR